MSSSASLLVDRSLQNYRLAAYIGLTEVDTERTARVSRGWQHPGSSHVSYALGGTANVPDLTDGEIMARIVYTPSADVDALFGASFQAMAQVGTSLLPGNQADGWTRVASVDARFSSAGTAPSHAPPT